MAVKVIRIGTVGDKDEEADRQGNHMVSKDHRENSGLCFMGWKTLEILSMGVICDDSPFKQSPLQLC